MGSNLNSSIFSVVSEETQHETVNNELDELS